MKISIQSNNQFKLVTAAIIFNGKGSLLITKRSPNNKHGGYWEFPGGKVEKGESLFQCIEREIFEELSVKAKAKKILSIFTFRHQNELIKLVGILTEVDSYNFQLKVHEEARWVPLHELLNYRLLPADIVLVKRLQYLYPRKTVLP